MLKECEAEVLSETEDVRSKSWVRQLRLGIEEALEPRETDGFADAAERRASVLGATKASRARESLLRQKAKVLKQRIREIRAEAMASLQTKKAKEASSFGGTKVNDDDGRSVVVDKKDLRQRALSIRDAAVAAFDVAERAPLQIDDLQTLVETAEARLADPKRRKLKETPDPKELPSTEGRVATHLSQLETLARFLTK